MLYFLAVFLPPLAVFFAGKPVQAFLNIFLCIAGFIPGLIHALFVVHSHYADKRADRIVVAIKKSSEGR